MPQANIKLQSHGEIAPNELPEILRTPSGTVLLDIQGVINVGERPLVRTELDLGSEEEDVATTRELSIGQIDLTQVSESGAPVKLKVGESQLLRGKIVKLASPLAVLDVSNQNAQRNSPSEIPCLEILTHKVVFSQRPEPVLSNSI